MNRRVWNRGRMYDILETCFHSRAQLDDVIACSRPGNESQFGVIGDDCQKLTGYPSLRGR